MTRRFGNKHKAFRKPRIERKRLRGFYTDPRTGTVKPITRANPDLSMTKFNNPDGTAVDTSNEEVRKMALRRREIAAEREIREIELERKRLGESYYGDALRLIFEAKNEANKTVDQQIEKPKLPKHMTLSFAEKKRLREAAYGPKKSSAELYAEQQAREAESFRQFTEQYHRGKRLEKGLEKLIGE